MNPIAGRNVFGGKADGLTVFVDPITLGNGVNGQLMAEFTCEDKVT